MVPVPILPILVLRTMVAEWPDGGEADIMAVDEFKSRINDDLDTPRGIAILWGVVNSKLPLEVKKATLLDFDKVLGLRLAESTTDRVDIKDIPADVQNLLNEREQARLQRKWSESDRLRDSIRVLGYLVEDTSEGSQLKRL